MHTYIHRYIHTYIRTYVHTYIHIRTHTSIRIYVHTYTYVRATCLYSHLFDFTFTHNPSSLGAAPANPSRMEAPAKCCLTACAVHIGENGHACHLSKEGSNDGPHSSTQPQLSAHHLSIIQVPAIITDSAPRPSVVLLYTTLKASASTC